MAFFNKKLSPEEIDSILDRADELCEQQRYREAFRLEADAANAGNAVAQCHMGWYCENGLGTEHNPRKAFEWYRRSAEQNDPDGLAALARCYEKGIGTPRNLASAYEKYALASEHGNEEADDDMKRVGRLMISEDPHESTDFSINHF